MTLSYTNNDYLFPTTSYVKFASKVRVDGKSIEEIRADERLKFAGKLLNISTCKGEDGFVTRDAILKVVAKYEKEQK